MGGFLKNVFLTTLIVAVATVASVVIASIASLLLMPEAIGSSAPPLVALVFGLLIAAACAMLVGVFFCALTFSVAAVTMPPALWIVRQFRLSRPFADIAGGMLAAWLCVPLGLEEGDSLAQYGLTLSEPIFMGVGVMMGALAGYARYRLVVRRREANFAPVLA